MTSINDKIDTPIKSPNNPPTLAIKSVIPYSSDLFDVIN
jgi:hypothetical protein